MYNLNAMQFRKFIFDLFNQINANYNVNIIVLDVQHKCTNQYEVKYTFNKNTETALIFVKGERIMLDKNQTLKRIDNKWVNYLYWQALYAVFGNEYKDWLTETLKKQQNFLINEQKSKILEAESEIKDIKTSYDEILQQIDHFDSEKVV